jgi:AraC-like DNA-binding protein
MEFSLSELFDYNAAFLGLLLSVIVIVQNKAKRTVKTSLFLMLVVASLIVLLGALNFSGKIRHLPHLIRIDSPLHFLLGPALYFYTLSSFKENLRFRPRHLLHFIPFTFNLIQFLPFYFSTTEVKLNYYQEYISSGSMIMRWYYFVKTISVCGYLTAQLYVFYLHQRSKGQNQSYEKYLISWFLIFFLIQFLCFSGLGFDHITNLKIFPDPYKFAMNMVSILLVATAVALLFFPKLLYGTTIKMYPKSEKYSYSSLKESEKDDIYEKWISYLNGHKPFLNPKLSIVEVSKELNTNQQRLSMVINDKTGMNFNDSINLLRIKEAKRLLERGAHHNFTIEAIAQKSGFNSKSPFYAVDL